MLRIVCLTMLMSTSAFAQGGYGGPPMWDRGPNPEYRRERPMPPPRRPWGPQMEDCIYQNNCRGPRYRDFEDPRPYPMPPYPRYEGED